MRTRAERRVNRKRKIKQRSNLLKAFDWWLDKDEFYYGKLSNNNEMNAIMSQGCSKKTNTRKSHSNYRHKGGYGSADNYSPRDTRQIDDMKEQINDL